MTDYTKLHLVCQDFALGEQSTNTALGNNQALFERIDKRHVASDSARADRLLGLGRHDDVLIARAVADYSVRDIFGLGVTLIAQVGSQALATGALVDWPPVRLGTGQWQIYIRTPRPFSADASIKGASIAKGRQATCFVGGDSSGPYVVVSTWNVDDMVLADYDFSLVVWAQGVD